MIIPEKEESLKYSTSFYKSENMIIQTENEPLKYSCALRIPYKLKDSEMYESYIENAVSKFIENALYQVLSSGKKYIVSLDESEQIEQTAYFLDSSFVKVVNTLELREVYLEEVSNPANMTIAYKTNETLHGTDCPAWKCGYCGELFEEGGRYCSNCGHKILDVTKNNIR